MSVTFNKLETPQDFDSLIQELKDERKGNRDLEFHTLKNFVVRSVGQGSPSGYVLETSTGTFPFSIEGIKSLCRLLKMDWKYFNSFPKKDELTEHIHTLLPRVIADMKGLLVRISGAGAVRAVLPGKYTIYDDEQVLETVNRLGYQTLGKLHGYMTASDRWDRSIYRLCFGESMLKNDTVYPCVNIMNSETGGPLTIGFGTLRVICTNGMMDLTPTGTFLNWGHRGQFDASVQKIGAALRVATQWTEPIGARIQQSRKIKIAKPGDEISRLQRGGWISADFADATKAQLQEDLSTGSTSGGATKYGVWNALTAAARGYRPKQRAKNESIAHRYLMLDR
jgi:hypothetical protein